MKKLSPIVSKFAAVALLFLVIGIAAALIGIPVWLLNVRYDNAVDSSASHLQRYSKIAGMREGLQRKVVEVKALGANHHFLKSASPALAAAELQEQTKLLIEQSGGKLNSIQILPHKDDGSYRQVTVALQLSASPTALRTMLYALETAKPYLFIDNLTLRSTQGFGQRNATVEPDLFVQLDVTGYALKAAP